MKQNANADEKSKTDNAGPATLQVLTGHFQPFNDFDENGKPFGLAVDLFNDICRNAGIDCAYRDLPWARAVETAKKDRQTALFVLARTPEREPYFHWIGPVAPRRLYFYRKHDSNSVGPTDLASAKKLLVGAIKNDASEHFLRMAGFEPGNNLKIIHRGASYYGMLMAGRIDLITSNPISFKYDLKTYGYHPDQFDRLFLAVDQGGYWIGLNKDMDKQLVDDIRRAFEQLKDKHQIFSRILNEYR